MPVDPFTAFTEGYQKSQQMGLLKLQAIRGQLEFAQKQKALAAEAAKSELEEKNKRIDSLRKYQEMDISDADHVRIHNALIPLIKDVHGLEMDSIDTWNPEYTKAMKRINTIYDNKDISPEDRMPLIRGIYSEVSQAATEKLKPHLEQAQKESEASQFAQGMTLSRQIASTPELAQSPEIMNQVLTERERLLSASTEGKDVLKAGMKREDKDYTQTATLVSQKDGKPHVYKYNPQTDRYDIDQGVAQSSAYQTGVTDRSNEDKYLRVVSLADNDDTIKQFKRTQFVDDYINKADKIFKQTGNAGILQDALIYAHNKTLDADSVVMVSEYLRSKGQQSLLDSVQGNVYKLLEGSAGLGPEAQKILFDAVKHSMGKRKEAYDQRIKSFRKMAKRYNVSDDELRETFPLADEIFGGGDNFTVGDYKVRVKK